MRRDGCVTVFIHDPNCRVAYTALAHQEPLCIVDSLQRFLGTSRAALSASALRCASVACLVWCSPLLSALVVPLFALRLRRSTRSAMPRIHAASATAAAALSSSSAVGACGRMMLASSSPMIAATLSACVARPATHAATGGRFLFRRFASAAAASSAAAAAAPATSSASSTKSAAAAAAAAAAAHAANSARVRADEAHAHAMDILRSRTRGGGAANPAAASTNEARDAQHDEASAASPHAAFATLMNNASMEQQQQRAAGSSASDASAQANSAAASSLHSTASAAAAHTGDETAALLTPAASSVGESFAHSTADDASSPAPFFAEVHPHAHAVDPALLSQLGMEEEELAALWRDYVHAQTQGNASASATAANAGKSVRTGLASFPSPPALDDPSSLEHVSRQTFAMQCALESSAVSHHAREYQAQAASVIKLGRGSQLGPASSMLLSWYTPFVEQLNEQLLAYARELDGPSKAKGEAHHHPSSRGDNARSKARGEDARTVGVHVLQLSAPELACITMHELFGLCLLEPTGVKFIAACLAIGKAVNLEVKLAAIKSNKSEWKAMVQALNPLGNHATGAAAQVTAPAASSSGGTASASPAVSSVAAAPAPSHAFHFSPTAANLAEVRRRARRVHSETWNDAVLARVGSMLLNIFMKVAAVPQPLIEQAEAAEAAARLENETGGAGVASDPSVAAPNGASEAAAEGKESPLAFGSTFIPPLQKGPRVLHGSVSSAAPPQKFYPAFQVSASANELARESSSTSERDHAG